MTRSHSHDRIRLLVIDPASQRMRAGLIDELPELLAPDDLVVVNDAATLPASLPARTEAHAAVEIRLLGPDDAGVFPAVLFGAGDFRTRTEDRPAPPPLRVGDRLQVGAQLSARILSLSPLSERLVTLRFDLQGSALWAQLYAAGKPVQYANQPEPLALWSVQTLYAARPWAAEMPSAGRPLSMRMLARFAERGVHVATLTHAAGLSSTGDPRIDSALPLPERYEIPEPTVTAIERTRARGGRVVAIGTTVVRALEASSLRGHGRLQAGTGIATLRIGPDYEPRVVDGLLSGIHAPEESHFALLSAFADRALLQRGHTYAHTLGYREHEFGDASLLLGGTLPTAPRPSAAAFARSIGA